LAVYERSAPIARSVTPQHCRNIHLQHVLIETHSSTLPSAAARSPPRSTSCALSSREATAPLRSGCRCNSSLPLIFSRHVPPCLFSGSHAPLSRRSCPSTLCPHPCHHPCGPRSHSIPSRGSHFFFFSPLPHPPLFSVSRITVYFPLLFLRRVRVLSPAHGNQVDDIAVGCADVCDAGW
jgi:hypothetical protein